MSPTEYFKKWSKVIDFNILFNILNILLKQYPSCICPEFKNIFRAFELCDYDKCRVIILSQDPYPQKGVATGIAFGNNKETDKDELSPSLQVIKETVINFAVPHNLINFDHTLEEWEKQGVLLLNSALTCEVNNTGSHTMLWRPFIVKLLQNLSKKEKGMIYVLLGNQAQSFEPYIDKRNNFILKEKHPSYYARTNTKMPNIFKEINNILKFNYNLQINWFKEYEI